MKCPLCQKKLLIIGSHENISRWDCPTKYQTTQHEKYMIFDINIIETHYSIRGSRTIINLFPYKMETWQIPDEYPGFSTIHHFTKEKGWAEIYIGPSIEIKSQKHLLERLKLITVFS